CPLLFFVYGYGDHRDLPSFPTRRSSDLGGILRTARTARVARAPARRRPSAAAARAAARSLALAWPLVLRAALPGRPAARWRCRERPRRQAPGPGREWAGAAAARPVLLD